MAVFFFIMPLPKKVTQRELDKFREGGSGVAVAVIPEGGAAVGDPAIGNPLPISGIAQDVDDTAPPSRVGTEGDATPIATDFDGVQFVRTHGPQVFSYHADGIATLVDAVVHNGPGAGLSLYLTDLVFSSNEATEINIFLEEGSTTVLGPYYLEATKGRGMILHFNTPKKITSGATLTITSSASILHSVDITGYISQG